MKSIIQDEKECYICKTTRDLQEHHICGGKNRRWSEKYGLKIFLCIYHHQRAHRDPKLARQLHVMAQQTFENTYGDRSDFMAIFGGSYIWEDNDTPTAEKREIDPIERRTEASEGNV